MPDTDSAGYKLHESISELFTTERTYIARLRLTLSLFSPAARQALPHSTHELVFGGIQELISGNTAFVADAESKSIAASLLSHLPKFEIPYLRYCSKHGQAGEALNRHIAGNASLGRALSEAANDAQCGGLDLASFLLEPVQRIARYPLLIRQILHYTTDAGEREQLVRALQLSERLLVAVNEGIREAEGRVRLASICIRNLPLDVFPGGQLLGETRFLGERRLRFQGDLQKAKSKKKLHGLLLSDVLLLLVPEDGDNSFSVYREPMPLDTLAVRECELARMPLMADSRLCMELSGSGSFDTSRTLIVSTEQRAVWIGELRQAIADYGKRRMPSTAALPRITRVIGTVEVTVVDGRIPSSSSTQQQYYVGLQLNTQSVQTQIAGGPMCSWNRPLVLALASLDETLTVHLHKWHRLAPPETVGHADVPLNMLEYYAGKSTGDMPVVVCGRHEVVLRMHYRPVL